MMVQMPPQQSAPEPQESPTCPQNDDAAHLPLLQSFEQHWLLSVHELPSVAHVALSGVHVPPLPQIPPQHCALLAQL